MSTDKQQRKAAKAANTKRREAARAVLRDPKASPEDKKAAFQLLVKDKKPKTFKLPGAKPQVQPREEYIYQSRRPTAARVGAGMLVAGIPGALLGFAFRKKTKNRIYKA
jgi:hypothetical protein